MSRRYDGLDKRNKGAWIVHHGHKTAATINGAAEFPALDTAAKAASLLSQLAASDEATVDAQKTEALAKAAGLNPRLELPPLLDLLEHRRVIDRSPGGGVAVLGLTTPATVQHAADIFEDQQPSPEERASIVVAELTSAAPTDYKTAREFISDEFKLPAQRTAELLERSETIGFVDSEGKDADKLYFNGNLFRRDNIVKAKKVVDSLSATEAARATELDQILSSKGCVTIIEAERVLGDALFNKLKAAGMDV